MKWMGKNISRLSHLIATLCPFTYIHNIDCTLVLKHFNSALGIFIVERKAHWVKLEGGRRNILPMAPAPWRRRHGHGVGRLYCSRILTLTQHRMSPPGKHGNLVKTIIETSRAPQNLIKADFQSKFAKKIDSRVHCYLPANFEKSAKINISFGCI